MNRRAFLQRLGFAAGAIALSPLLDLAPIEEAPSLQLLVSTMPTTGMIGCINRATYTFWRNQAPLGEVPAVHFADAMKYIEELQVMT